MPKPWLKMWSSSLDNEKIQSLSGDQTKAWLCLLRIALRHDKNGELPSMSSIAFQSRIAVEQAQRDVEQLTALGLVEVRRNHYVIHDWKHWQGDGMSDAQRKRNQRDRERNGHVTEDVTRHVTDDVTNESNVTDRAHAGALRVKTTDKTKDKIKKKEPRKTGSVFASGRPEYISEQDWADYLAVRKHKRAIDSEGALRGIVKNLDQFRADGLDPGECLRKSIRSSWIDVFAYGRPAANGHAKTEAYNPTPEEIARMNAACPELADDGDAS
jgi:hypothetical protein